MSRLLITLGISAITLTGCGGQSPPPSYPLPTINAAAPTPQPSAEHSERAAALSETTAAYAQEMESHLHKGLPQANANPNVPRIP